MRDPSQGRNSRRLDAGRIFRLIQARIWPLLRATKKRAAQADIGSIAGSLAFTTVLSIAPLLAVIFYIFKAVGAFDYGYSKLEPFILSNLSEGSGELVANHLRGFIRTVHAKAVGWVGFAGLLFTAFMTYSAVAKAFQKIWERPQRQSAFRRLSKVFVLVTVCPVVVAISISVTGALEAAIRAWHLPGLVRVSTHFFAVFLNMIFFSLFYWLVPPVNVRFRTCAVASVLPAISWEGAKMGYAIYTSKVVTYSSFYGSFAAIPLFFLWIYIGWYIALLGAVWMHSIHQLIVEKN